MPIAPAEPLSPRNPEVARLRALTRDRRARHDSRRFVVEGPKLLGEALASRLTVFQVIAAPGWEPPGEVAEAMRQAGIEVTPGSERAIERIASTVSPQGVVAEVALPDASWHDLAADASVVVLVDVNDPGNVGTLARSAVAAGFDAVIALGATADPFGPKTLRAAAGAAFQVPVIVEPDAIGGLERLGRLGPTRYGTRMADAAPCDEVDLTSPVAFVLGSEANGLDDSYAAHVDGWLAVPMPGPVESLNVAMAGAILTYETARQRRRHRS